MNPQTPNTGSFMSSTTGNSNGVGPALARLLSQAQSGGTLNQNSQSPTAVMPSSPPPMNSGSPMGSMPQTQPQSQPTPNQMPLQQGSPEVQIALRALAQYINSAGKVHEAQNGVQK